METISKTEIIKPTPEISRDNMNNEVSSTSSDDCTPVATVTKLTKYYKHYTESTVSDNEMKERRPNRMQSRSHFKSTGNLLDNSQKDVNLNVVQNSLSNVDLSLHREEIKKFESLQIPIVGYEVMEERARFTIYKLKVEDDKRDQSWLVFRRYTDFVRLYSRIKAEQPNILLPLPGKRWFRDNFDSIFLEERVRGLQIFINAILKKLPNHPVVREFFCLDEPPQVFSYQPEVQAVYGALEDSIMMLKMQLKQKDATLMHLQKRVAQLEGQIGVHTESSTDLRVLRADADGPHCNCKANVNCRPPIHRNCIADCNFRKTFTAEQVVGTRWMRMAQDRSVWQALEEAYVQHI